VSASGRAAIDFAARFMPALHATADAVRAGGRLVGMRVGIALTLEPKTACLAESLAALGAEVSVLGSAFSTQPAVAEALAEAGLSVFVPTGDQDREATLDAFCDTRPQLLVDDGAEVVRHLHRHRRDVLAGLVGVAEETTSGVRPLQTMAAQGVLEVPCVAVNDARVKSAFDNVYGTGHSVVLAVLDATNVQLSGASVLVVGYGQVGHGIARAAAALGARVTVTEIDPVQALLAHHDGYRVARLADALADAEVVLTATGVAHTLTAAHLARLPDGALVAVGGMGAGEIDLTLDGVAEPGEEVRPGVRAVRTGAGTTIDLLADGHCVNTTLGEGNPIQIMDLSLALQMCALDLLAAGDLAPGVHELGDDVQAAVAAAQLADAGIVVDQPSAAQRRAAASW
jgi:adenosylhomocysteinase